MTSWRRYPDRPAPARGAARRLGMRFVTRRQGNDAGIDWLLFYNHRRLYATLGYLSSMAFAKNGLAIKRGAS